MDEYERNNYLARLLRTSGLIGETKETIQARLEHFVQAELNLCRKHSQGLPVSYGLVSDEDRADWETVTSRLGTPKWAHKEGDGQP